MTSDEYGLRWFEDIFLPLTDTGRKRLLYLDGQSSHISGQIQWSAFKNNVTLCWIVPHSSHIIQPLDQQPFAQVKAAYSRLLRQHDPDSVMAIKVDVFDVIYAHARGEALTKEYIQSSWRRAGLWPFDKQHVLTRRDVRTARKVTPPTQPPKTTEFHTPKRPSEWLPIAKSLQSSLDDQGKKNINRMIRTLDEVRAEALLLRQRISVQHHEARQHGEQHVQYRIQKHNNDMLANLGGDEEQIELMRIVQPQVFYNMLGKYFQ